VKQLQLIRHLKKYNCYLLREGGNHRVYYNPENGKISAVPRHKEIKNFTALKICKDLDIPKPF
jgi:predicted RNA binding protein YcfA (HicA-like mRNA interferase family)